MSIAHYNERTLTHYLKHLTAMQKISLIISLFLFTFSSFVSAEEVTADLSLKSRAANYLQLKPTPTEDNVLAPHARTVAHFNLSTPSYNQLLEIGEMEVIRKITVEAAGTTIKSDTFNLGLHIAIHYEFI